MFEAGETVEEVFDQYENVCQKYTNAFALTWLTSGNTATTVVDYTYDSEQKLVREKQTVTYSDPSQVVVSHKKYSYNTAGEVVRTESWYDGEQLKTGVDTEEIVYDDMGRVVQTYKYNSMDSSGKICESKEYDDFGKVVGKATVSGEKKTQYSYVNGTYSV
ncbi:MAG: hypothetical protein IJX18_02310, partial [Clostridia bacterium]|nr:hypothetical protein [Clostridia bacterium]